MRILGLTTMGNSAAALIEDGKVVFAAEEERFTRIKNDGSFPLKSIQALLEQQNLNFRDIDLICIYWERNKIIHRVGKVLLALITDPKTARSKIVRIRDIFLWSKKRDCKPHQSQGSWRELFLVKSILTKNFGEFTADIKFLNHHACHVASALDFSDFRESLILSYDGGGESVSTLLLHQKNGLVTELLSERWPNSLGHFYSIFTGYLGFQMLEDEYKVMGLSALGNPVYREQLVTRVLRPRPGSRYRLNAKIANYHEALEGRFSNTLVEMLGPPRKENQPITDTHKNIAASVQVVFEEAVLNLVRFGLNRYPHVDRLCIVGGCGLNVVTNGRILTSSAIREIFVPPAPHDAGCAIGAGIIGHRMLNGPRAPVSMNDAYLGQKFSNSEIRRIVEAMGWHCPEETEKKALSRIVAEKLASGLVVAWFQGGSEFGPRALGNRSILADPRNGDIQELMNRKIKKRELFRPFAPSVKEEKAMEYFEISQPSPYMNIVATVKDDLRDSLPAVTHVDNTARVHSVRRETNPRYWELLHEFEQITGFPILLNTSFNIQEPIVNAPNEAIETFLRSEIDLLVLNDFLFDSTWRARCSVSQEFSG